LARSQKKGRGKKGFLMLYHEMLKHPAYTSLSTRGKAMLIDVGGQYNGRNNGDLVATHSVLSKLGWNSNDQIKKAVDELIEHGFLVLTRQGRRPRVPSLYAITWQAVDECDGKLEEVKSNPVPLNYWKLRFSDHRPTVHTTPPHGAIAPSNVVPLNRHTVHKGAK